MFLQFIPVCHVLAVGPYLPENTSFKLWMLGYSLVFFVLAAWLALSFALNAVTGKKQKA